MDLLDIPWTHIVYLDEAPFSALVSNGECPWAWPAEWANTKRRREAPAASDLCVALDASKSHYWFEFEPEQDLNLLLDASLLVRYADSPPMLVRTRDGSLRDVVRKRCDGAVVGRPPERTFLPATRGEDEYGHWYTDAAVEIWNTRKELFGQLAVCGCGEPGCGATYAWLQDPGVRLLVEISAAGIRRIEVGPFALRSSP
jgi:hypothetical protein